MLIIAIIKWSFVVASVLLSIWLFNSEQKKIRKIRNSGADKAIVREFQEQSKSWMQLVLFIFCAILVWMLSYDFVVQDVSVENKKLSQELEKISLDYASLEDNRARLLKAQNKNSDFAANVLAHYRKVFTNYYLMRQCKIAAKNDVFIINSAMMREIALNNLENNFRAEIIKAAKTDYKAAYENFDCDSLHGKQNEIIRDYQNYIIATREVLLGTF